MTAPQEDLTVPLALVELYGALDMAVIANPELGPLVDQYLPGASQNAGWSNELYETLLPEVPRNADVEGTVESGLRRIMNIAESPGFIEERLLTIPDLSNLVYAIGTLSHLGIDEYATTLCPSALARRPRRRSSGTSE